MVRGRKVKAAVPKVTADRNFYTPKKKVTSLQRNGLMAAPHADHLITQYFAVSPIQQVKTSNKRKLPLSLNYCPNIKISTEIKETAKAIAKDEYIVIRDEEAFNEVFLTSSPHRIELHTDFSENDVKSQENSNTNIITVPKTNIALTTGSSNKLVEKKLTDFFPVRRSVRKTKQTLQREKEWEIEKLVRDCVEDGLEVRVFDGKGRGVVTTRPFKQGDFVVEYNGELLDVTQAKLRETQYAQDLNTGCYMYYFKYKNQQYCVDATAETGRLGRLVNHSRNGNLITRTVAVDGLPRLVLIAKEDIKAGDEITYDYGDRSKESLEHHPWLAL